MHAHIVYVVSKGNYSKLHYSASVENGMCWLHERSLYRNPTKIRTIAFNLVLVLESIRWITRLEILIPIMVHNIKFNYLYSNGTFPREGDR
jgi:hypothetical protein